MLKVTLEEVGIATVHNYYFAHHLAHNHLKVLVVDLHALQAVNLLNFIHQVLLHRRRTLNGQNVCGRDGSVAQGRTCTHEVVLLHQNLLAQVDEVATLLASTALDHDFTVATLDFSVRNRTVNLCYYRRIRWITGLKELGHTRKSARDVTRFGSAARNLHQDFSGLDLFALVNHKVGTHRQGVVLDLLALLGQNLNHWNQLLGSSVANNLVLESGLLVNFNFVAQTLNDVLVSDNTREF